VEVSTAPEGAKTLILDRDPSSRSAAPPYPAFATLHFTADGIGAKIFGPYIIGHGNG